MNPLQLAVPAPRDRSRPRRRDPQSLRDGDRRAHRGRRGSGIGAARRDQRIRQRAAGEGRRARGVARRRRRDCHRRVAGRALRRPHADQEPRLLAGRDHGADARDRRQRRDLQPVQGPRAEAAARCERIVRPVGGARPHPRAAATSACRIRTIATSRSTIRRSRIGRLVDDLRQRRSRHRCRSASSRSSSPATTSRRWASARNWAARCCPRTMSRRDSIRSR